ncbi:TasA family protein [Adlercreutzia sp. ZJ141]|uniref:TasA family protein n=1 Tax=Adlercreutzia sp. ZJ141 TaxID=2709406 RepID=UPI0013EA185C|nr:TasA family protein [Adlercreutzia sp. ZJ141]
MEKTYNKKLVASVVLMVSSLVLLAGLTFAWFTDSAVSSNNKIQAGTLDIEATVANVEANATTKYQIDGVNGGVAFGFGNAVDITTPGPIIAEEKWEPGATNAKLLTVTNKGNLAAQVKLQFDIKDEGLQDALWFDFVQVKNGQATGQFTQRPMNTLNTFASGLELPVGPSNEGVAADADFPNSVSFILVYGMYEEADNNYQGKSFSADVTILATQYTYEADGFGNNQYDKEAKYPVPVSDNSELKEALAAGESVCLTQDVSITETLNISSNAEDPISIDLNGKKLSTPAESNIDGVVDIHSGTVSILNGTIESNSSQETSSALYAGGSSKVTVDKCVITSTKNKTYAVVTNGAHSKEATITITDSKIIAGSDDNNKGYVGYFPAGTITLKNCTATGHIFISGGTVNIDGGTYTATGFSKQDKIWYAEDSATYIKNLPSGSACNFGDSILIYDNRDGYTLSGVSIKNVVFNTEISLQGGSEAVAYAIKYVARDYAAVPESIVVSNCTYNNKIKDANPVMFINTNAKALQ